MRRLIAVFIPIVLFVFYSAPAYAVSLCPTDTQYEGLCGLEIGTAIGNAVTFIYILAIVIALFYLIWGGLKWLTSGGDKAAVQAAREHIVAAIVGLVLIFLSYLILSFIAKFFLGADFNLDSINLPVISGGASSSSTSSVGDGSHPGGGGP